MNDLVERRAATAGIAVARAAVGTIPVFHSKERLASTVQSGIEAMFGAKTGAETFAGIQKASRHPRTS
ncbi:hypothetical protein [Nitrobacter sp. TKz-YC01]